MAAIAAGRLRHKLQIRRKTQVDDGKGGYATSWPVIAEPWAEVIGLAGREAVIEDVLRSVAIYRITIRWRNDILPGDQLSYGSIDLNIKPPADPDGRREQLVFVADTDGVEPMNDD